MIDVRWKTELARMATTALRPVGLQISRSGSLGRNWNTLLPHLKSLGFDPDHVIDVGAGSGTNEIYHHFPNAELHLFEPLSECVPALRELAVSRRATVVQAVVGREAGSTVLHVHEDLLGSSTLKEAPGGGDDGIAREVPVVTLDEEIASTDLSGPVFLKVDVQGTELEVFAGAPNTLDQTDVIVVECSLLPTMDGGAEFREVIEMLHGSGFALFDLTGGLERPLDNSLSQIDATFVKVDSPWRSDRRFRAL